jgi:hypothetical protein
MIEQLFNISGAPALAAADSPTPSAAAGVREFWAVEHVNYGYSLHKSYKTAMAIKGDYADWKVIPLVEKSAYDALLAENQRLNVRRERDLEAIRAALEVFQNRGQIRREFPETIRLLTEATKK